MNHDEIENQVSKQSAKIYLPVSVGAALTFLLAAILLGDYSLVAKLGGTFWVGLLSMIVTMPIVTSNVKRKLKDIS